LSNILEASPDAFYIKIMRFAGFLCVQIHSWNANVSLEWPGGTTQYQAAFSPDKVDMTDS